MESPTSAVWSLLPLGRRCPEGADEGAFISATKEVPPHQLGRMTYARAIEVAQMDRQERAAVSHGLASSPRRGEGERGALTSRRTTLMGNEQ